jgi:hypothetical protein
MLPSLRFLRFAYSSDITFKMKLSQCEINIAVQYQGKDRVRRISPRRYRVEILRGRHGFSVRLPELVASPTKASARLPHSLDRRHHFSSREKPDLYRDTDGIYS